MLHKVFNLLRLSVMNPQTLNKETPRILPKHIVNCGGVVVKREAYDRGQAVKYAKSWARARNPRYYNFDGIGGDCTNFASQCLFAGSGVMNYTKDVGWYYNSPNDRAPAWSDAQYLNNFLMRNKQIGPVAAAVSISQIEMGDFVQLHNGTEYYHTLVVTGFSQGEPLVCAHTEDAYMRPLRTYYAAAKQGIHILGVNRW